MNLHSLAPDGSVTLVNAFFVEEKNRGIADFYLSYKKKQIVKKTFALDKRVVLIKSLISDNWAGMDRMRIKSMFMYFFVKVCYRIFDGSILFMHNKRKQVIWRMGSVCTKITGFIDK